MPRPPQARPEAARLEEENSELRRKLRESERRSQLAVGILRQARAVYGIETSLAWIALIAMVLVNAAAFSWAR